MRRTSAPPVKQFKWHYIPRNRGASFGLRSDLTVCLGTTACRPKSASSIVTHRASHFADKAKQVVLQEVMLREIEQCLVGGD